MSVYLWKYDEKYLFYSIKILESIPTHILYLYNNILTLYTHLTIVVWYQNHIICDGYHTIFFKNYIFIYNICEYYYNTKIPLVNLWV